MKIYISADIEGVAGIAHWDEARKNHSDYFREQMTQEVLAACRGALSAGATEIVIKDAHATARNIELHELPACAKIIRGWSGHPFSMVQELDKSFDAVLFIGYHSPAGSEDNPLSHTLNTSCDAIVLNEMLASEYLIHAYAAESVGVPVVFVSGDKALIRQVNNHHAPIETVATLEGVGDSTVSVAPKKVIQQIEAGVQKALAGDLQSKRMALPENFDMRVRYNNPTLAYQKAFYPEAAHCGNRTIAFASSTYFEILRFLSFVT